LNTLASGAHVNLEIDLIARYVERMLRLEPQLATLVPGAAQTLG